MPNTPAWLGALRAGLGPKYAEQADPGLAKPHNADEDLASAQAVEQSIAGMQPGEWVPPAQMAQMSNPTSDLRRANAMADPSLSPVQQHDAQFVGGAAPLGGGIPGFDPSQVKAKQDEAGLKGSDTPGGLVFGGNASAPGPDIAPARAVTIPEHEVRLVSKDRQAQIAKDLEAQQGAARGMGVAASHAADNEGIAAGLEAQALDEQSADIKAKAAEHDAKLGRMQNDIDAFSKHVSEQKVDPEHWASNAGIGTKIALVLASALGGWASSKTGGPNVGLQAIQSKINEDIEAQRHAIELKKGRVGDMKGIYADAVRRFGEGDQADAAARVAWNQSLAAKAKQYAAATKSETVAAEADKYAADLQLNSDKVMADMNRNVQAQTVMTGGPGSGSIKPADNSKVVPIGKGVGVMFRGSDAEAQKARELMATNAELAASFQELRKLQQDAPNPVTHPVDRLSWEKRRDRAIASIETTWNVKKGQGAMSEGDRKVTDSAIGALRGVDRLTTNQDTVINDTLRDLDRSREATLNSAGGMMVKQSLGRDQHGNIIEQWTPTGEIYAGKNAPIEGKSAPSKGYTIQPVAPKK